MKSPFGKYTDKKRFVWETAATFRKDFPGKGREDATALTFFIEDNFGYKIRWNEAL